MAQLIKMIAGGYEVIGAKRYLSAEDVILFGQPILIREITKQMVSKESSELGSIINEYAKEMRAPFYELGKRNSQVQLYVENTATK